MPLLSRAEAQRIVGPHFGALFDIITSPWTEYMAEYTDKQRAKHCATTRAAILHDLTVHKAAAYFTVIPGSRVFDALGLKIFTIEDDPQSVAIRFKKLDEQLLSRNQPTGQVSRFRRQEQMDFLGAAYHLEAGYVLDKNATRIEMASVVCPNGNNNFWDIELTATTAVTKISDMFDPHQIDEKVNIVRPKIVPDEQGKKSDDDGQD